MSVRNGFVLLVALSALLFLAGCGSSSPTAQAPPGGGFSNSNLNGTYVFSFSGLDVNANAGTESFFTAVGTLSADGSGNIKGGTVDIDDPDLGGVSLAQTISASKYTIGKDGRGSGSLPTPVGTFGIDFVVTSNGQGLITRFDNSGSGSGTLDLQSTASQGSLQALAFSLSGADGSDSFSLGSAGTFTLDSSGNITGTQDFNEGGSSAGLTDLPLAGSVVLTSGTAGTAQLDTSFGALSFDVWVIDATHLKLIETDGVQLLSGDAFTQQTSIPAGTLVFTLGGFDSSGNPFAAGGLMTSDGNGNLNGFEDFNDAGSVATQPLVTGACTLSAGRCQLVFTGFSNGLANTFQFAVYPSSGGIQLLEVDSLGITQGAAYVQSSTALSAPQGYGLNLTGFDLNSGSEVDDIAEFTVQTVGSNGSGDLTGIVDINDAGPVSNQSLGSGSTYTPDSPATGRGAISTGQFALEYYTVDASNVVFIEADATQVATGAFQLQSASSSPGPAARQGVSALRPSPRPMVRSHSSSRKRK